MAEEANFEHDLVESLWKQKRKYLEVHSNIYDLAFYFYFLICTEYLWFSA
jgi:hypothetical protein